MKEKEFKNELNSKGSTLPINGKDIMEKFSINAGPIIGAAMGQVSKYYKEHPNASKNELFNVASEVISTIQKSCGQSTQSGVLATAKSLT